MKDHSSGVKGKSAANSEFWQSYEQLLRNKGIPENRIRFYRNWVAQFARSRKGTALRDRSPGEVARFLAGLPSLPDIQPWQVKQATEALRFLYSDLLQFPWATPWPDLGKTVEGVEADVNATVPADALTASFDPEIETVLARVRTEIRLLHYSIRTEQTYLTWARRFIAFHHGRHPRELGAAEVKSYLEYLAEEREVSANTQRQALNALVFLYDKVLQAPFGELGEFARAKRPRRLPTVLSREEVTALLGGMCGTLALMAKLLYGCGLRLMEGVRLRMKDVDFDLGQIVVRDGKGQKDRVTMLPESCREPLRAHLERVRELHREDLAKGFGEVWLPPALARKYPQAGREWGWQYVSGQGLFRRSPLRHGSPAPRQRRLPAAGGRGGGTPGGGDQTGLPAHPAPLLRHPPARGRFRYPYRAGTARP